MTHDQQPNPVALDLALAHMESLEDTEWLILTRRPTKEGAHLSYHGLASSESTQQMIAYAMTQLVKKQTV